MFKTHKFLPSLLVCAFLAYAIVLSVVVYDNIKDWDLNRQRIDELEWQVQLLKMRLSRHIESPK